MSAQPTLIQTANYPAAFEHPRFSFLAKPPPQKRRRAAMPGPPPPGSPPPPPVSITNMPSSPTAQRKARSILSWATHVQPGSPTPRSPHQRRLSSASTASRRSSFLHRRPSVSGIIHTRATDGGSVTGLVDVTGANAAAAQGNVFGNGYTPTRTPSTGKFDLTALGYATVFVQFPKTPTTPSPYLREYRLKRGELPDFSSVDGPKSVKAALASVPLSAGVLGRIPIPPIQGDADVPKQKSVKRFRSLTILRPTKSKTNSNTHAGKDTKTTKKQMYPAPKPKSKNVVRAPPPLANELALMQFADGGRLEDHAQRVMEAQARAARGHGTANANASLPAAATGGVGTVHHDAIGGVWWDADEEMEYAPLLDAGASTSATWEAFAASPLLPSANPSSPANKINRTSISTADSSLTPARLLPLPELADARDATSFFGVDRVLDMSTRVGKTSVLALPARARRASPHLCSGAGYLVDGFLFVPPPPGSPVAQSASVPRSPVRTKTVVTKKPRRRPAPLTLANSAHTVRVKSSRRSPRTSAPAHPPPPAALPPVPQPARTVAVAIVPPSNPTSSPSARCVFLEDSFAPVPASVTPAFAPMDMVVDAPAPRASHSILIGVGSVSDLYETQDSQKKRRGGGMRGLFGLRRSD